MYIKNIKLQTLFSFCGINVFSSDNDRGPDLE